MSGRLNSDLRHSDEEQMHGQQAYTEQSRATRRVDSTCIRFKDRKETDGPHFERPNVEIKPRQGPPDHIPPGANSATQLDRNAQPSYDRQDVNKTLERETKPRQGPPHLHCSGQAFSRLDFPTFGRPMIATRIPTCSSRPRCAVERAFLSCSEMVVNVLDEGGNIEGGKLIVEVVPSFHLDEQVDALGPERGDEGRQTALQKKTKEDFVVKGRKNH